MRTFTQFLMETTLPSWATAGRVVAAPDLEAINDDLPDIIEDDEWDYVWRLTRVPVEVLPAPRERDVPLDRPEETRTDRLNRIRAMKTVPPVIVTVSTDTGEVRLLDGHHRLQVARERGWSSLPALVGTIPAGSHHLDL